MCGSTDLHMFLDLGMHPHSDGFIPQEKADQKEPHFPLACNLCQQCGNVQLTYTVFPEFLYNEDYVYDGSITATGTTHFLGMAKQIVEDYNVSEGSLVVDVGSNVGLLLSGFRDVGMQVLGVDPAEKPAALAKERGVETIVECFSPEVAQRIIDKHGPVSVLTGTNVFAHIDDIDAFVEGAKILLSEDGMIVIEAPYLVDLCTHLEYDTIYHQHLSYLSVAPLQQFFAKHDLELFHVIQSEIHGGSIRFFVAKPGAHAVTAIVEELIAKEKEMGLHTRAYMDDFAAKTAAHKDALMTLLNKLKSDGKTIAGIGAPAKGMTLLNYCGIDTNYLEYLTEKSAWKQGKIAPGVRIPIVDDETLLQDQPDYALILAWNFAPEIMGNLDAYKQAGGQFILPIPSPSLA